jgi:excisionase family DNA binding protein
VRDPDKPATIESLVSRGLEFGYADEIAQILRCDPRTVRRACESGAIPAIRLGTEWRIPVAWLVEQARAGAAA